MSLLIIFISFVVFYRDVDSFNNDISRVHSNDLPKIKDGEPCVTGQLYKLDCNTCKCGKNNSLLCSRMGCPTHEETSMAFKSDGKDNFRKANEKHERFRLPNLPKYKCKPGKLYQKKCQTCFCNDEGYAVCSNKANSCDTLRTIPSIQSPEDFGLKLTKKSAKKIPTLPHAAAKCDPGKVYRVDCNVCLCLSNRNLWCTHSLCISYEDMNRVEAKSLHGKPCKSINDLRTANQCVKCTCKNEKFDCEPVSGCQTLFRRSLHGPLQKYTVTLRFDVVSAKKCLPSSIYKANCNKCYCQESGHLRCTQKKCLTYKQTLIMKKQLLQLENKEKMEVEMKS